MSNTSTKAVKSVLLSQLLAEQSDKRLDILRRIRDVQSISEAARSAGISYKAAWQAIETLTNLAGGPLINKAVGGANGGGSTLTPLGEEVLALSEELYRARQEVLLRFEARTGFPLKNVATSSLQTSMRNQLLATIETLKEGAAIVVCVLKLPHRQSLKVTITRESAQLMSLRENMPILAMFKATCVTITKRSTEKQNVIRGRIIRASRASHGGEATIELPSGNTIVGLIPKNHGLHIDDIAEVYIPASAIVLALTK